MSTHLFDREQCVVQFPQRHRFKPVLLSDIGEHIIDVRILEAAIKRLIKSVNRLGYTRNARALAAAAERCHEVEQLLRDSDVAYNNATIDNAMMAIDAVTLIEAHQLLAQARGLLYAPLEPVVRAGNVVELRPNYRELTDAAFERLLEESDIPQLLSCSMQDKEHGESCAGSDNRPPSSVLSLVYSRD